MKYLIHSLLCCLVSNAYAQPSAPPNIFIITTDGFRWQEIFSGADEKLLHDTTHVRDTALLQALYWHDNPIERRRKLMPFTWNLLAQQGSLYGNRKYGNKVSVANPYRFSYAGYNELFTGYADNAIIANNKRWNSNENILEYLNMQTAYKDKVAAFTSWNLFPYIFNERRNSIYLNSAYEHIHADSLTPVENMLNGVQQHIVDNQATCRSDMLTFISAKEYIQKQHPKIVYIGFGETDEWAHHRRYDEYLNSAHLFDEYIAQLWYLVNKDPFYRNNTSFIITTDHGRGKKAAAWAKHGPFVPGSDETWLMVMGPKIPANGEVQYEGNIQNEQLAQTITRMLGYEFVTKQSIASPVYSLLKDKN